MSWWCVVLIVLSGLILLGPIMYGFAKLNKIDPFILDKINDKKDLTDFEVKSLITITVLRPLFVPLWLEKRLIDWLKKDSN